MYPDLIILNGTGSSGKTSMAKALQEMLPIQYLNFSVDSVLYTLPPSDLDRMMKGEPITRQGYDYAQLVAGYHACIPALLSTGVKLIVDNAWIDSEERRQLLKLVEGYHTIQVGVFCDLIICEERELARGDRAIGLARYEYPLVHQNADYDLQVDTSELSPEQAAQQVMDQLCLS